MKHLIKENKIIQSGIPGTFTRENGEGFWGGYENRTDLHYEDGWRDEVIPNFNPRKQHLENLRYDVDTDICIYDVVDNIIDLNLEKDRLLLDLKQLKREFALLCMQAQLTNDPIPEELSSLFVTIRNLNLYAINEINALTEENVLDYVLRGPIVNQLFSQLNEFL